MYNEYEEYDIDNPDLENEMYIRDIQEELDAAAEGDPDEEKEGSSDEQDNSVVENSSDTGSDADAKKSKTHSIKNPKFTEGYFEKQLAIKWENERDVFRFVYDDEVYIGKVIYKLCDDKYVIDSTVDKSDVPFSLHKFTLSKMKKYTK